MEIPIGKIREQVVKAEIRIRDVNARKLADDSEDPGNQDTPENISFDILYDQDSSDQNTKDRKEYGDPRVAHGRCETVSESFVVAVNREQTYKRCSTNHDLRILKTKECDEETDSNADRFL